MTNPPLRLLAEFQRLYDKAPQVIADVDGRVMWVGADFNQSHQFVVHVPDLNAQTTFDSRSIRQQKTALGRPLPKWARYLASVTLALGEDNVLLSGGIFVIVGDEPQGPRYEHALGMAFASVWLEHYQLERSAKYLLDLVERQKNSAG
jgi:hypothetical protein